MNLICNAARNGTELDGAWIVCNGEPCLMCGKLLHHAGIVKVIIIVGGGGHTAGIEYLQEHGVAVEAYVK